MENSGVSESKALQKMISDLMDFSTSSTIDISFETRSEAVLQSVLERIQAEPARLSTDPQGRITAINPAFSHLCGHSFESLKGCKPGTVLQGPESSKESIAELREAVQHKVPCSTEIVNYHKNGSTYRVGIKLWPDFSDSGELVGFSAEERKLD